jgi:Trypsin-co-occurring domain 1
VHIRVRADKEAFMVEILIPVVAKQDTDGQDLWGGERLVQTQSFEKRAGEIADSIAEVASQFRSRFDRYVAAEPDELWALDQVEVTFALEVQAEAGVLLARASTTGTFTAKLRWGRSGAAE